MLLHKVISRVLETILHKQPKFPCLETCFPCTSSFLGRTHQLRVHCSAIGHPIVGDFTYSFKKDSAPYRMMLHAYYLCIPTSKELIEVSAPDPFVPSFDSSWVPQRLTHHLDELIQELKDKGIWAGEEEKQEDPSAVPSCEVTPEMKTQEMEEQQTHCKQWLSEWTPE